MKKINNSDLKVVYYDNKELYDEKGLANDYHMLDGAKVKYIVGYDQNDDCYDIGYIFSESGLDIEAQYDESDLDRAFMISL